MIRFDDDSLKFSTLVKSTFLTILFSLTVLITNAQVRIGPQVGGNLTNFVGAQEQFYTQNSQYKLGFRGGFAANFPILDFFSVQAEFLYSQQGAVINEEEDLGISVASNNLNLAEDWEVRTDMHYLQLPLLIKLAFGGEKFKFYLNGGGYGAYLAASEYTGANGDDFEDALNAFSYPDLDDQYKEWDLGYTGGFGFQFTVNDEDHFLIDFRFSRSLNTITNDFDNSNSILGLADTDYEQYNQAFSLSFSYLMSTGS